MLLDYVIKASMLLHHFQSRKWLDINIGIAEVATRVDSDKNNT